MSVEERYINQISVVKTSDWLIELVDKLNIAPVDHFAHIHAKPEKDDSDKVYSLIGITMIDYSAGTGDKAVKVFANMSPEDVIFIYSRITAGSDEYLFRETKIFGNPDSGGLSQASKLFIKRTPSDQSGKAMNSPWQFCIQNGSGVKLQNRNGGSYMKKDSFSLQREVKANLTDLTAHALFCRAVHYIQAWELAFGPALIRDGRKKQQKIVEDRRTQKNGATESA